ncbi:MAG: FAD-dependent oxidoreductase [Syntrophales bacterium]|nr:FAD-dependent oxidoreductase [Syntrophales bacterium]
MRQKEEPNQYTITISGMENGMRVDSRVLEERIQNAVKEGHRKIHVIAYGQHGIGGRLWSAGRDQVFLKISGAPGQRLGSMGAPNTFIEVDGPASDDVGWLNTGAQIVIRGHASNGTGNAMAQGKIFVAGDIGARGMTMTKHNPRYDPPELWVLGSVGDAFAEFMAGGIAVICGWNTDRVDNILGHRPCVGMVGGKIFFRGKHKGYSEEDAMIKEPDDEEWNWLSNNLQNFLKIIGLPELFHELGTKRNDWLVLVARKPHERKQNIAKNIKQFREEVWERELGTGGLIGDIIDIDKSSIEVITTGDLRRFIPVWENGKYFPPCQANCPTGIPVQKRWELIRKGLVKEAIDLSLHYTPFPATVCGHLCPNLCMENCTRKTMKFSPVDVTVLGKASLEAQPPSPLPKSGHKIAVIGGGPAGLSVAWQLWMKGHEPEIFEQSETIGGKITSLIPTSRIPEEVVAHELKRIEERIRIHTNFHVTKEKFLMLKEKYTFVIIAAGAQKPRMLPVPGIEKSIPATHFLKQSKQGNIKVGKKVVVIGAGNVGCDVAVEAIRGGATEVTLIDIQQPASFGKERKAAEAVGAQFRWPCFTDRITDEGVFLKDGSFIAADTVVVAIGDQPDLDFLPPEIPTSKGFIVVDKNYQTSDPQVFAIGDVVRQGLLTEAIGAGRFVAEIIDGIIRDKRKIFEQKLTVDPKRVKLEYLEARNPTINSLELWAENCASCGVCRDCGVCESICPQGAITRTQKNGNEFEYQTNDEKCIGCGFCVNACPTGVWCLIENTPVE